MKLVFGEGSCGIAAGARKVRAAVEKLNADGAVEIGITGCIGMCYLEPIVDVYDGGTLVKRLVKVQEKDAERIYKAVAGTASVQQQDGGWWGAAECCDQLHVLHGQKRNLK